MNCPGGWEVANLAQMHFSPGYEVDAMKSLSERIAERARDKAVVTPHSNRAVVLALRSDIQQAVNDGWSVLAIYQTLHDEGRLTFSYQAFRRYVNQLLPDRCSTERRGKFSASRPAEKAAVAPTSSFTFNPLVDTKDLL
ncbi:TraK family protein [Burkholderia cenocepacia]|uniref:TraK family protein n=1 Tax=Burkholderia cenocepacia TaxID=95486 RepID=UPI00222FEB70|nr:TraK family protein [Burkholderia cenocepacia]MCW3657679.1 TraK family protein [Burkholderia cenocepacia]MDS0808036.1 TraK family protein [Burkholderia cenocepacia]